MSEEMYFTREHEWVRIEDDEAIIGISDYAQKEMGDVTFIELPEIGMEVSQSDELGVIESVKAASDIFAPIGGTVTAVNTELLESPHLINTDPYGQGWICKLGDMDLSGLTLLMSDESYEEYTSQE
ncbi:MAG: glycine cleavage system protein GcvH [Lentisphaerae bacterium]|nr:glycine cleavage system protein GcvH [Lentisphaerota bacterium]